MALPSIKNRVGMTVTGTPGVGTITLNAADTGYQSFVTAYAADANVDILIEEGSAWEIARDCAYTNTGTTVTRGTLEASSTGAAVSFTAAAKVYGIHSAARIQATEDLITHMTRKFNSGFFVTTDNVNVQSIPTAAYTALHGGTGGALLTAEWNPDLLWSADANGRFTPPAGRWRVYGIVTVDSIATTAKLMVAIRKNSEATPTRILGRGGYPSVAAILGFSGSTVVEANGTDYFQLVAYQDSGAARNTSPYTGFCAFGAEYEGPIL